MTANTPTPAPKVEHTPGPWVEVPQRGAGPIIAHKYETGSQMSPTGLRLICHVLARGNSLKEDEANARLIAQAPTLKRERDELLEALRLRIFGHDAECFCPQCEEDRALFNRIEGKS